MRRGRLAGDAVVGAGDAEVGDEGVGGEGGHEEAGPAGRAHPEVVVGHEDVVAPRLPRLIVGRSGSSGLARPD